MQPRRVARRSGRQEHAEHRPAELAVLDVDPAVVLLHDARDHGEAQARTTLALLRRVERIEDPILDLGGDADAIVGHRDRYEVLLGASLEPRARSAYRAGLDHDGATVWHRL